jgi:hypothetical protein
MWIIQKNAVSDEQQDSIKQIEYRFRSGGMVYQVLINKPMGFSQSFLGVLASGDIIWQKSNISQLVIN